jgi:hypothetical protein
VGNKGLASHPFTWEDSVEKFDRLVAGRADEGLCQESRTAISRSSLAGVERNSKTSRNSGA